MLRPMPPTPLDIQTQIGRTPVRISIFFWLSAVVLGWDYIRIGQQGGGNIGFGLLLGWVIVMFASILLHEFGHVWAFRLFGVRARIELIFFGGVAIPDIRRRLPPQKDIVVSAAGPFVQFLLAGAVYLAMPLLVPLLPISPAGMVLRSMLGDLLMINVVWGLFNLLPLLPLDGGWISRSFLTLALKNGEYWADVVGVVTGAIVAVLAFRFLRAPIFALFLGYLAVLHFQRLKQS